MIEQYIYGKRAVAFLDVLGFQNKLKEFENEASQFYDDFTADEDMDDNDEGSIGGRIFYSQKANDFIDTFNKAISKLDTEKFSYYLFSDNICITAKNIGSNGEKSLIELLLVISELYFEFVKQGYFLRGGIDYGLFIDKASIALGNPLAVAYKLESTLAVFPRIILSNDFVKQLSYHVTAEIYEIDSILNSSLIKMSCEIQYLNIFNHIFKVEDKEDFFEKYNHYISENLSFNMQTENIYLKYKWLADEFNAFIETYTSSLAFYDENFEPTEEYIKTIKQLKISYGQ